MSLFRGADRYSCRSDGGGARDRIKTGISLLAANGMIHVEHVPSRQSEYGVANAYWLPQNSRATATWAPLAEGSPNISGSAAFEAT